MSQKELSKWLKWKANFHKLVRQLCEEHGFSDVLDSVSLALEHHLYSLQEQIDHIPGKSPNEQAERRTWKCPECSFSTEVTYNELAEAGFPMCMECDVKLER